MSDFLLPLCACETLLLLLLALFRALGSREIRTVQEKDYTDSLPRTFVGVKLRIDREGIFLADRRTDRALVFTHCRSFRVENTRCVDPRRSGSAVIVLEGIEIEREKPCVD